jgi:hypothetical protein
MKEIELDKGYATIVDDGDYDSLRGYKWHAWITGSGPYARRTSCYFWNCNGNWSQTSINMARQILDVPKGLCVDHINGNTLDNRRANLRICTREQNNKARHKILGAVPYKGVTLTPKGRYRAHVSINRKLVQLGTYDKAEDAAFVYNEVAKDVYGDYAVLNELGKCD